MEVAERRELVKRYLQAAMSREAGAQRHVALMWPASEEEGRAPVSASIDARRPGSLTLSVRISSPSARQSVILSGEGYESAYDRLDPRSTAFSRSVLSASIDDLATFVEWVFLIVADAPDDYVPGIQTPGGSAGGGAEGESRGCFSSCATVGIAGFLIIAALTAIAVFLR